VSRNSFSEKFSLSAEGPLIIGNSQVGRLLKQKTCRLITTGCGKLAFNSEANSKRRSLHVADMSASAYRFEPAQDRNCVLKEKIIALAQRHRRYGVGMICLKLRQSDEIVNHKCVKRLYAEAGQQVKSRRRKKTPLSGRHTL
jgi:HTH-like domain